MLKDTGIRALKPREKSYKVADGSGLYMLVHPNGGKYWRLKYRFAGKEKLLALGTYPDVSLAQARERRDVARKCLTDGADPGEKAKAESQAAADTFEAVAREWFAKHQPLWAESHATKIIERLQRDVFPWIGSVPVRDVTAPVILEVLRRIESRGAIETAHRAQQNIGQVLRYAIATGRATRNPAADLKGALTPVKHTHYAAIVEPAEIGALLRALWGYDGRPETCAALKLAPLTFVRPGELRRMEWVEIDLEAATWKIPAHKMKGRREHVVPLSLEAVEILRNLQPLTGSGRYVFPALGSSTLPMSANTVNAALHRLGYTKDEMTGHGFRALASTRLNELGFSRDAIERQLSHADRDKVRAAYDHSTHLQERRKMMQAWASYLDGLRNGAQIVTLKRA